MKYLVLILAFALSGCATTEYESYAKAQADVAKSRADADTARFVALSKIAESGTDGAKIAAVMALALGGGTSAQSQGNAISAPQASNALQWASILVPSITNVAGMAFNARVAMANADNNARIAESTNSAFLGIAGKIQAPVVAAPIVPQANVSTVTTTTNDNHASTTNTSTVSTATTSTSTANPTTTSTSLGGSGVIGNGVYTASPTTANPVTTTTNNNPVTTTTNPPGGKTCSVDSKGVLVCI